MFRYYTDRRLQTDNPSSRNVTMKQRILHGTKCLGARSQILLIFCISIQALYNLTLASGQMQTLPLGSPMMGPTFKSTDSGATWVAINTGINCQYITALTAVPNSPGVLYAGTDKNIFKTTDGGNHWVAANGVISLFAIRSVAVDTVNVANVYAVGFAMGGGAVLKSTDAGLTWNVINAGLPMIPLVSKFVINPVTPSIMYVEDFTGLYKSTNKGNQWSQVLAFPTSGDVRYPQDLKLDPLNPSTLYVVDSNKIYKSADGGSNWVNITGQIIGPKAILTDPIKPSVVYVTTQLDSIYKSIDGGATWILLTTQDSFPGTGFSKLAINPVTPSTLYSLTSKGIFKSIDGGINWINTGALSSFDIHELAFDPANPSTMYAGGSGGVRQTDTPSISSFKIDGEKLYIFGAFFDDGAVLLLDGQEQSTKNDSLNPAFLLIAKEAGKKIKKNPKMKIRVRNANGKLSQEVPIWPPLD
jgi:hypothetical protein